MGLNISTREQIEFTVIGKAAHEAAGIEVHYKKFGEIVLVFDAYASCLQRPRRSHGTFNPRNIGHQIEILSPDSRI